MIQEIKYNGITTVPSDYECPDGDMSGMINAVIEDGVVRPLCPPTAIYTPKTKAQVKYIHKVGERTNYILVGGSILYWYNGVEEKIIEATIPGIKSINSIGNTLVVIADEGMHYILWKADEDEPTYKYLGTQIPELDISFGLQGHVRFKAISFNFDNIEDVDRFNDFTDDNKRKITNQVLAKVNSFIAEQSVNEGRFCFPFFIRYALRLYDGTLVNHSAPILMMPSTEQCPMVMLDNIETEKASGDMMLVAADVDYLVLPNQSAVKDEWSDIVKEVVVYASKPIYSYDQNGECKRFVKNNSENNCFVGKPFITGASSTMGVDVLYIPPGENASSAKSAVEKYYEWRWDDLYHLFKVIDLERQQPPVNMLELPLKEKEAIGEDINSVSAFYLLETLPIEDIDFENTNRSTLEIDKEYLQSLTSREVMTDDYLSHDRKIPSYAFAFNNRLNIANVSRQLYKGYNPYSMFSYCEGDYLYTPHLQPTIAIYQREGEQQYKMWIDVFVKDESGDKIVRHTADYTNEQIPIAMFRSYTNPTDPKVWGSYLFYPNTNAYKIRVWDSRAFSSLESPICYCEYNLKPHSFLNGSSHYIGRARRVHTIGTNVPTPYPFMYVSDPNKVYTSEINNPFYFPVTGINTIGTGEILGISSAVKALSQGQFGQFPMYVFATDGVWALETSASGTFNAKQPVTRDVCICPESITQVDGAVLFATDRGIMMLQGSTANCISLDLDKDAQDLTAFPQLIELLKKHQYPIPSVDSNFKEYAKDCRMVYDYVNQRIIIAKPNATYAYVYSMKSNKWGMIQSTIVDSINSYPEAYAVGKDGGLLDYSNPTVKDVKATLVTRPIKFDTPNELKTIRTIVQRGMIERRDVKFILYGSRDLVNWYALASTTTSFLKGVSGTPYKYFRLAIMADLKEGKSIYGATMDVNPKYNNRIR